MRRRMIYALIVCLLWGSLAPNMIGANEGSSQPYAGDMMSSFQELLVEGLSQPEHSEHENASLAIERPVLDPKPALTNQHNLTFTGISIPSSSVQLYYMLADSGVEHYAGEGMASLTGSFEIVVSLEQESVYTFYARAVLEDQTSENSEPIVMELDRTPPSYPLDIYTDVTYHSIAIYWSSPTVYDPNVGHHVPDWTVDHYEIRRPDGGIVVVDKDTPFYEEAGLSPESSYQFYLYAVDAAGNHSTESRISIVTRHQYVSVIDEGANYFYDTAISGDGNWIAYRSINSDGPGLFIYDRSSEERTQIGPGKLVNWDKGLAMSADGRFILYQDSDTLNGTRQYSLQLYSREEDSTIEVLTSSKPFASLGLSNNGNRAVFSSDDDDIVQSTADMTDVFLLDLSDRSNIGVQCLSYTPYTGQEQGHSKEPYISSTGAYVVFESVRDQFSRIYLHDVYAQTRYDIRLRDGQTEWMGFTPTVSDDGNYIAFSAIKGTLTNVEERLTGYYIRSNQSLNVLHRVPGSSDISFGTPYIRYYPHHYPADHNIYVAQEYSNYNPSEDEAPYLSQSGVMHYTSRGTDGQVIKRNLISNNGNNAREARLNREGTAAVFRDGSSNVPGNAIYYVCLRNCAQQAPIESVNWSVPSSSRVGQQLRQGSEVALHVTGAAGQQLEAFITFKRLNEAESEIEEYVMTIPLTENPQGTYRADFALPQRAVEITSITARLTNRLHEMHAADLPILVAGGLRIDLDVEEMNKLDRTEIVISGQGSSPVVIPVQMDVKRYETELVSGDDYTVVLRKLDGNVLVQQNGVQIANGRMSELTLKPQAIYSFYHLGSMLYNQFITRGQYIPLRLVADEGAAIEVTVLYSTAHGAEQLQIAMTAAGSSIQYEGGFEVPQSALGITSIRALVSYGSLSVSQEALRNPLIVAGSLEIEIGNDEDIQDYKLTLRSESRGIARNVDLKEYTPANRLIAVDALAPAPDYRFTLLDRSGGNWLETPPEPVAIEPGQRQSVVLHPAPPSAVVVQVRAEDTNMPYVTEIVLSDGTTTYTASSTGGTATFSHVDSLLGKKVTVSAVKVGSQYQASEAVIDQLAAGRTNVELIIKRKDRATVIGRVTDSDGNPVQGALVRVTMNQFVAETIAVEDGTFSLESPTGIATISASYRNMSTPANARRVLLGTGQNFFPLVIHKPLDASIDIQLYTKYAGGDWVGPHEFDWRTAVHYRVTADRPILSNASPFRVRAAEGELVTICVNGIESGLPTACGTTEISEDMTGSVELRLAQFDGKVAAEMFAFQGTGYRQLYRVNEHGKKTLLSQVPLAPGPFVQQLPSSGTYEYLFYVNSRLAARRQFEAVEDGIVQLGVITSNPVPLFTGYVGNEVSASKRLVTAGSHLQIRAAYNNGTATAARDAKLWLDIPATAEYATGSAVWNGQPVEPIREGQRLYIALGDISAAMTGTVYYTLVFEPSQDASTIVIAPELTHERSGSQVAEWLGNVQVQRLGVTLTAPTFAAKRAVPVSGIAPPGSTVRVYDRSVLLGEALTAPNGAWKLTVETAGATPIYTYVLSAEAEKEDSIWRSGTTAVRIDSNYPEAVEFTMQQTDGRKITLDPRDNGSKFPYVHAPGLPYHLAVVFNHPQRVRNVRFVIDTLSIPATELPDGTFVANTKISKVGSIGIDYDIVESTDSLGTYVESEEERMAALPSMFQDAEEVEINVSPRTDAGNKQTASYRAIIPTGSGDADYRMEVSLERKLYTPSQGDLDRAEQLGIPVYGTDMSYSFRNGRLYVELSGYIPEGVYDSFAKGETISPASTGLVANKAVGAIAARFSMNVGAKAGDAAWIGITNAFTLYDGSGGMGDILNSMGDLLDDVALNCSPEAYEKYAKQVDALHTKLIINEVMKAGIAIGGAIMGPATFGIGTVALFIVSASFGKLLDAEAEGQFNRLKDKVDSDSNCKREKKPRKPKKELADPVWIHDPSGYVFEVEHSNRIENVKATALQWSDADGRWQVWDADWFGQQNPLYTGSDGRYGWDVPEGRWKVLYEKEGYLPGESWEMTVLPPHFDVNVGLVSIMPPAVVRTTAAAEGAYVDFLFNRHILGNYMNDLTVSLVSTVDRQPIGGQLSLIDAVSYQGNEVSRRVRFTPDSPLEPGVEYELTIDEGVQSYNGISMEESYHGVIVAAASDEQPPVPVSELVVTLDASSLIASWKEAFDPDLDRLEVQITRVGSEGAPLVLQVARGVRWVMAEGLESGAEYQVEVHALDAADNRSITRASGVTGVDQAQSVDTVPPTAPTEVTAITAAGGITVAWTDPEEQHVDHIRIAWRRSGQLEEETVVNVNKGVRTRLIGSLSAGASYDIYVYAAGENGLVSNRVYVTATAGQATGGGNSGAGGNSGSGAGSQQPGEQPEADRDIAVLDPEGGQYSLFEGKVAISLPKGALVKATELMLQRLPIPAPSGRLQSVSPAYKLELANVQTLVKSGTISFTYDAAMLKGADARKLGVYRLNRSDQWEYAGGVLDLELAVVKASFQASGTYALMLNQVVFADMTKHWAKDTVEVLAAMHIISGVSAERFEPSRAITRAEFAKLIVMLARARAMRESEDVANVNGSSGDALVFTDVANNAWYAEYVHEASSRAWIQGSYGKFYPNHAITREEMMLMIARMTQLDPSSKINSQVILEPYSDAGEISEWARTAAAYLIQEGLVQGANGAIHPKSQATRAEAAAMLLRLLEHRPM